MSNTPNDELWREELQPNRDNPDSNNFETLEDSMAEWNLEEVNSIHRSSQWGGEHFNQMIPDSLVEDPQSDGNASSEVEEDFSIETPQATVP